MSVAVETQPRLETDPRERTIVSVVVPLGLRLGVSPDDFEVLCAHNRDLRLERNAKGELIAMSPSGSKTNGLEVAILSRLFVWAESNGTGRAFGLSGGFTLPNGAVRAPDACWVKENRWKNLTAQQRSVFAPIAPDFVIEICSPSDNRNETRAKMVEYLEQGVRLGWLIDARTPEFEVEIHCRGQAVEILSKPQTVSGDDVLPGFTLELGKILTDAP